MTDTDEAWQQWGRKDPYYGVASVPQFRQDALADNLDAFFAEGKDYVDSRLALAERLFGPLSMGTALDFGSGVGRLALPLAGRFGAVTGLDISEDMNNECRANAERRGIGNLSLAQSDDRLSAVSGPFDFVNSYVVLQHIPVARGMALIERLLQLVGPGGVANLQVTVDRGDTALQALSYWAQRKVPGFHAMLNMARGRRFGDPPVQMNEYSLPAVIQLFHRQGFGEVTLSIDRQARVLSANLIAQKVMP